MKTKEEGRSVLTATLILLPLTLLPISAWAADPILALDGEDIAFGSPRISTDGLRGVAVRTYFENLIAPATGVEAKWRDVVVLDLRANCAEDVVRQITHDGSSYGASVDQYGGLVYYWHEDGEGDHELVKHVLSTGAETMLLTEDVQPLSPGTSADGDWAVWVRPGSPLKLMVADLGDDPPEAEEADSGSISIAHDRAVTDDGEVLYTKTVSGVAQLFSWESGSGETQLTTGSDPNGPPSVTPDGSLMAFRRKDGSVPDIWVRTSGGSETQLTSNGDSSSMSWVTLTPDGEWVVFASNADLDGSADNSDGSSEIFRILADDTGSAEQISNQSINASRDIHVTGTTGSGLGSATSSVLLFGVSTEGVLAIETAGALHYNAVYLTATETSSIGTLDDWDPSETSVAPPFDVRSTMPGEFSVPCVVFAGNLTCKGWLRNSVDRARKLLLAPEWTFESPAVCGALIIPLPTRVDLEAEEGIAISTTLPMSCAADGTYRLRVIDLEVAQADLVQQFEILDF